MKVLITGGLGFVGIHLARFFAEKGAEVVIADILKPDARVRSFLELVKGKVSIRPLDVCQRNAFQSLVQQESIDNIIHAAAITPDYETEQARMDTVIDVNLVGALNAIIVASQFLNVGKFILCSSSGLYGAPSIESAQLQNENSPLDLDTLYSITKFSAELLVQRCGFLSGKSMTSVRLASIYGEMERPTGSREHMSHVSRLWAARVSGRKIRITGKKIARDWMYADDMAEAVWALLCSPKWHYPVYNIGTAQSMSFEKMVEIFAQFGLNYLWIEDQQEAEISMHPDQARAPMDTSRLKEDTDYRFPYTSEKRLGQYLIKLIDQIR